MSHPMLLTGSANQPLAEAAAKHLGVSLVGRKLERFPDGELGVMVLDSVRGGDVYLIQPTGPPVEQNLLELLLLADACWRAGSSRITGVIPYFGYSRQDRRSDGRQAVAARLVADFIQTAKIDRIVAVDLHNTALESAFGVPLEHLSAVPILAGEVKRELPEDAVVVAPDLGATKLADRYAARLGLPVAIVHKMRISGDAVRVQRITGDVRGRVPIVVDDMISTGGTIEAAIESVREAGAREEAIVVATHALLVGPAIERLRAHARRLIVADTVAVPADVGVPIHVASVAPILAEAIARLHLGRSLSDLIARG